LPPFAVPVTAGCRLASRSRSTRRFPRVLDRYDQSGTQVIRKVDTLAEGVASTFGGPAIVIINGVQRTSGPGSARIVGFTPDGVPIVDTVAI